MTACDPLELEILPPYIGSAVSPTVDITETTDDITVTITDFRGEHSYSVDKTDQAIADAEQAATNANAAASQATQTANQAAQYARDTADQAAADAQATADEAAGRADTAAGGATQAAQAANTAAGTANTAASNANDKADLADSKASLANTAATTANQAAQAAEAAKTAANAAAGQATTAAGNATTAAGQANTAASNADAKAALADTAAANADTATQAANTATTAATNAAQAANNAADVAIEAAEDMPRLIGTVDTAQTVADAWETTMESATVYGKSVQDGTPTPDNPVPVQVVGGKNLFDMSTVSTTTPSNWDVSYSGDTLTIEHKNTYSTGQPRSADITLTAGAHTISFTANPATNRLDLYVNGTYEKYMASGESFTVNDGDVIYFAFPNPNASTITYTGVQLEQGTHATPYTPYGCIGLQTGETSTTIDLQGHTLAGVPDGTRDELDIDAAGVKTIRQRVDLFDADSEWLLGSSSTNSNGLGYILRYTGLSGYASFVVGKTYTRANYPIGTELFSEANDREFACNVSTLFYRFPATEPVTLEQGLADMRANGAYCYCKIAEPQTIELGTITPPAISPGDTLAIYASLDPEWAIEYTQDPNLVVYSLQSSIAPVEGATASTNYAVGAYLMHGNQLYRVTSAIATGEAITPGSNCVACTVMGEVIRLTA